MFFYKFNIFINFLELKFRLFYFICSFIVTFFILFYYKTELFFFISHSFLKYEKGFIYTNVFDPLIIYLKLSFLFSIIFNCLSFIYLLGFFFFKSFYTYYTLYIFFYFNLICLASFLFFLFFYFIFFSFLFEFLLKFQQINHFDTFELTLNATITNYYFLFFNCIFIYFILIFIPNLVLIFLKIFDIKFVLNHKLRKYLYLLFFIIFLFIAPPDFLLQLVLFPILFFLLEIIIYGIFFLIILFDSF